jgi:hypothetical protein
VSGTHDHQHDLRHLADGAQPEVFAATAALAFVPPDGQAGVEAAVREFLRRLSPALAAAGCVLIGHIKGVVLTDGDELEFSLTRLDAEPRFAGGLNGAAGQADLTLNVIVFGVAADALPGIIAGAWPHESASIVWRPRRD